MSSAARALASRGGVSAIAMLVAATSIIVGCSDDDDVTPTTPVDTGVPQADTTSPDTMSPDTAGPDTAMVDTPDATAEDTAAAGELVAVPVATAPTGPDDPLWATAPARRVTSEDMSIGLTYGEGELNMTSTKEGTK